MWLEPPRVSIFEKLINSGMASIAEKLSSIFLNENSCNNAREIVACILFRAANPGIFVIAE